MTGNGQPATEENLNLQSRVSELARIRPWIERLASRYAIPESTQFAMDLCLEEVLSNIIRHGYAGKPHGSITIRFTSPRPDSFVIVVEDEAPPFNPVDSPELPPLSALENNRIGGLGILLLRRFAGALEYQTTPAGNRLSISFPAGRSALAKD